MDKFLRTVDRINKWTGENIFCYLLAILTFVVMFEVVSRYAFGTATKWVFETSTWLTSGTGILGGAYALLVGAHIRVDVFWVKLSERGKAIMDLATFPFFLFFCGLVLWRGTIAFYEAFTPFLEVTTTDWAPVLWPIRMTVPLGSGLLLLQGIAKLIRDWRVATQRTKGET